MMAYRVFNIPAMAGSGDEASELNAFLRGHKVVAVNREFVQDGASSRWCFCVEYLDGTPPAGGVASGKIDYREVLDDEQFARFRVLREARKKVAEEDGVPVYAVFSNDQLAEMAKIEGGPDEAALRKISGIGEKKIARYGRRFLELAAGGGSRSGEPEGERAGVDGPEGKRPAGDGSAHQDLPPP